MVKLRQQAVSFGEHEIVVCEADVRTGMKRSRRRMSVLKEIGQFDPQNDMHLMQVITFPDVLAATISFDGRDWESLPASEFPMDFETFLSLPDALLSVWMAAIYELNPYWLAVDMNEDEHKKKS